MPRFASTGFSAKLLCLTLLAATAVAGGAGLKLMRGLTRPSIKEQIRIQQPTSSALKINLKTVNPIEDQGALENGRLAPRALASGDFNEDGVPDLISGYGENGSSQIRLYLGAAPQQGASEQSRATLPFASPKLWQAPITPDFIVTGDFDADGHLDLALASRQADKLYLLSGDGTGDFTKTRIVPLKGSITALIAGDDRGGKLLLLGVQTPEGAQALLYNSASLSEAESSAPQVLNLSHAVTALASGYLEPGSSRNFIVAAGNELYISAGSGTELKWAKQSLSFAVQSMAVGNFSGRDSDQLALLSSDGGIYLLAREAGSTASQLTRRSRTPRWQSGLQVAFAAKIAAQTGAIVLTTHLSNGHLDELTIVTPTSNQLQVLPGASAAEMLSISLESPAAIVAALPLRLYGSAQQSLVMLRAGQTAPVFVQPEVARTFIVNSTGDGSDFNPGDGICNSNPSVGVPVCTLRAAIQEANANPGTDTIIFNIGAGAQVLSPTISYPAITEAVTIDGTPQNGAPATQTINIDGTRADTCAPVLTINSGSSVIRNLSISNFTCSRGAIYITRNGGNIIQGNTIFSNLTGITIDNSPGNLIGGTTSLVGNKIYTNSEAGITVLGNNASNNQILGNSIGPAPTGLSGSQNIGVYLVGAPSNAIGGTVAGSRNIISNNGYGIVLAEQAQIGQQAYEGPADNNVIQGNYIGVGANGTDAASNLNDGILLAGANNNLIGGIAAGAGNIIANNGLGARAGGNGVNVIAAFSGIDNVTVPAGINNTISANSIYNHGGLGINLGPAGVTPNDPGDADTGANLLQNFPVVTSALTRSTGTTISGTLNSTPSRTAIVIELFSNTTCNPSGNGEGQTYLGRVTTTTDASGNASFTFVTATVLPAGTTITATATDSNGNTSEFSVCFAVQNAVADLSVTKTATPNPVFVGNNLTYDITVTNNGLDDATGIRLTDSISIPNGQYTLVSATTTASGGSCTGTGPINCTLGTLSNKTSTTVRIVIAPTIPVGTGVPPPSVTATNTASVSAIEQDRDLTNNLGAVSSTINASADVSVTETVTPARAPSGSLVSYTVTIRNNGPSNAAAPLATITLPSQLINIACTPAAGAICNGTGTVRQLSIANLAPGATTTATLQGTVGCLGQDTTLTSTAVLLTGGQAQTFDPNGANNSASATNTGAPGSATGTITYDAGGTALQLGPVVVGSGTGVSGTFTLENTGCLPMNLTTAQFLRVDNPLIPNLTTKDDSRYYTLRLINTDGSETPLNFSGADRDPARPIPLNRTLGAGQRLRFRVTFNPPLPFFAGFFARSDQGINANQVLPDALASQVVFNFITGSNPSLEATGDPGTVTANITARVSPAVQIIPRDGLVATPGAPLVILEQVREDFRVRVSLYDPNKNVTKIVYQFYDTFNQPADNPITVDLTDAIRQSQLLPGQNFTIQQDFVGASGRPDVTKVRVTVSDGDGTSVGASSSPIPGLPGLTSFSVESALLPQRDTIQLPPLALPAKTRDTSTLRRETTPRRGN